MLTGYRFLISNHSESASADRRARQMRERLAQRRPNHFQTSLRRKERVRLVSGRFGRTPSSKIRRWNLLDSGPCYRNMLFPCYFLVSTFISFSIDNSHLHFTVVKGPGFVHSQTLGCETQPKNMFFQNEIFSWSNILSQKLSQYAFYLFLFFELTN